MNKLFALGLLAVSLHVSAFELRVTKMTALPGMDRSFSLQTKSTPDQVVLDCQSFIQGLTIGAGEAAAFFFLDPQDCEGLYDRTRQSLRKFQSHCIDLDDEVRADYTCS